MEVNYYEKNPGWVEQQPSELDFQLKDNLVKDFDKIVDEVLDDELKDKSSNILKESLYEIANEEYVVRSLESIKTIAHEHFEEIKPCPKIDEAFLHRLYNKAVSASLLENSGQGNTGYNKGFHHALIHNTIWECKLLVERRIIQFIEEVIRETASTSNEPTN